MIENGNITFEQPASSSATEKLSGDVERGLNNAVRLAELPAISAYSSFTAVDKASAVEDFSVRGRCVQYFEEEVDTKHTEVVLLVCSFISGVVDSAAFNAWGSFASMQTAPVGEIIDCDRDVHGISAVLYVYVALAGAAATVNTAGIIWAADGGSAGEQRAGADRCGRLEPSGVTARDRLAIDGAHHATGAAGGGSDRDVAHGAGGGDPNGGAHNGTRGLVD
ncbi:hypothetical protein LOZ53_004944 [Ophidiomyces ophidiicola]|uniref:Uncharacterized protein n=1 Tax=Ophidiomyces ophidiicola TaxID=1387563 RepID=A0ACB8UTC5_9EURO|nr:uncharacterized protein LOZ57_002704 [Ophidiomyces ophidiicola]KAI1906268.1 hypothetical protein LOZ61_006768 [Ophidiomyces ophidiicola]KAI1911499.1 hypothetical protein LOZ64_004693 [Ophidiomyces ophidiicola]KAI1920347.1 hypothetical protein LOZ60_006607 [Ophidiomyces ophidiicola]KAI1945885.1 hypothetical protein LOZ62_003609 [Ophidiomyces ophidiicola]KAI1947307.1 hypothetical protein LOZ59_006634 [Ophidiomyces ophidiicola]